MATIVCQYCHTVNDANLDTCLACGGTLASSRPPEPPPVMMSTSVDPMIETVDKPSPPEVADDFHMAGEKVEQVYASVLNTYTIFWRTVGEMTSISLTGVLLGLIGGATERGAVGVAGGVIVGLVVGLTNKTVWWAALSAPAGALLGCILWIMAMLFGAGAGGMVYTALVFAVLLAIVGGRQVRKTWWDTLRPFLGMGGGLIFALIGWVIGLLLHEAAAALLGGI